MTDRENEYKRRQKLVKQTFAEEIAIVVSKETHGIMESQKEFSIKNVENNESRCIIQFCENYAKVNNLDFEKAVDVVKRKNIYLNVGFNRRF